MTSLSQQSVIYPLLKKATLDKDQLSNYRPISNLSLLSKIIERVVKSRLTHHISSNNLFNPNQSAYAQQQKNIKSEITNTMPVPAVQSILE